MGLPMTLVSKRCGKARPFLSHLHGDKGGLLCCIPCRLAWDKENFEDLKGCPKWKRELYGVPTTAAPSVITCLTSELLQDAIVLTHPDRHPPERQEYARRVTAELLELKPYVLPKAKPKQPVTEKPAPPTKPAAEPLRLNYPCATCFLTVPVYYCYKCRARWDQIREDERDRINRKRRKRRARQRHLRLVRRPKASCTECGTQIKSVRKDASSCSAKCRQRAHRKRVTHNQPRRLAQPDFRNGDSAQQIRLLGKAKPVAECN